MATETYVLKAVGELNNEPYMVADKTVYPEDRCKVLFKDQEALQLGWRKAIHYLRDDSKCGWTIDKLVQSNAQ